MRKVAIYTSIPFEFFTAIGLGAFFGRFLDRVLNIRFPIFTIFWSVIGFFAALYHILKYLKK